MINYIKLGLIITAISKTFAKCTIPTKEVAIDEYMIKFKGRSYLKHYMPKKPNGRKKFSSGIIEKTLGGRVVLQLMN